MPIITLTHQESEQYFYNALCNGLGYISSYGLELEYDEKDYQDAKRNLVSKGMESPCYEDVLMEILIMGKTLTLKDNQDIEPDSTITIEDVWNRVKETPFEHLSNMINENDDAITADIILQTVFLNEVMYG